MDSQACPSSRPSSGPAAAIRAFSSTTPLGSREPARRRKTPPTGSGVAAVMPAASSALEFIAAKWLEVWMISTGTSVETWSSSSRVGWRPSRSWLSS